MNGWNEALGLLPEPLRTAARAADRPCCEEIRLRIGQHPTLLEGGRELDFSQDAVTGEQIDRIVEKASGASLHAVLDALREGYLPYRGLRLGLCGVCSRDEGRMTGFRRISSLAIRIPHELPGLSRTWFPALYPHGFRNTLLLSPPGGGKTTALRDLIRELSSRGWRVAVADERGELSANDGDGPRFDLGAHCDILTGLPKTDAVRLLLRAMNPQILAMDEISYAGEVEAVEQLCCSGVGVLASCHVADLNELAAHPLLSRLAEKKLFPCCLVIRQSGGKREYAVMRMSE